MGAPFSPRQQVLVSLRQQVLAVALLAGAAALGVIPGAIPAAIQGAAAEEALPARLRGTIAAVDGRLLTVTLADGKSLRLRLAQSARMSTQVKASLADVKPGAFVGITSVPDDKGGQKAVEIHVFPDSMRGTGEGQRPWDLMPQSTMTNGNIELRVDAVGGQDLTLSFKGGSARIDVPPQTVIVAFTDFTASDLKPGNKAIFFGLRKADDGVIEAGAVSIGRDGLAPPM